MIIVRIWEGLGNQLFQYAYARALQQRSKFPVYLDIRHHNRGDIPFEGEDIVKREIGIQHFKISMKRVDTKKIFSLRCLECKGMLYLPQYFMLKNKIGKWHMEDDAEGIDDIFSGILNPGNHTYVNAHCMNKEYYTSSRDILLQELQLKRRLKLSENLRAIIAGKNTVSLHIRLTDYLRNPAAICGQRYYDRAIQYMEDTLVNPYFIIFTDDPHMAKARYKFGSNVYWASEDGYTDYEELAIMSKCGHNIIAGSTFSYWGAWLNQNPEKIVIAPKKWFGGKLYEKGWRVF